MADDEASTNSPSTTTVVITSTSDNDDNPISSSDDRDIIASSSNNIDEDVSQSVESTSKILTANDGAVSSSCENGFAETKSFLKTPNLVLKPSLFASKVTSPAPDSSSNTKSPLRSPKLNFSSVLPSTSESKLKIPVVGDNLFAQKDTQDDPVTSSNTVESKEKTPNFGTQPSTSLGGSSSNFVFGQNLHERVSVNVVKPQSEPDGASGASCSNGNSEMLFSSVLSKEVKENVTNGKEPSNLIEDAARYQEARSNKRKLEDVALTTGEEGEENVLQLNVKLFAFDNGSWLERGRSTLRLNDKTDNGLVTSRIVVRTHGTLRVVLNTKIWRSMALSQANERSIRITALDADGQLKIFLIQCSPKDMQTLYKCLEYRLKRCKETEDDDDENKSSEKKLALSSSSNSTDPIPVPVPSKET